MTFKRSASFASGTLDIEMTTKSRKSLNDATGRRSSRMLPLDEYVTGLSARKIRAEAACYGALRFVCIKCETAVIPRETYYEVQPEGTYPLLGKVCAACREMIDLSNGKQK